jgi:hypothetical protein
MLPFFSMPAAFVKALRDWTHPPAKCWACQSPCPPLEPFNVIKDLRVLGPPDQDCRWAIRLCPACAEAYKASFNAQLQKVGGERKLRYRCKAAPKTKRAARRNKATP